MHILSTLPVLLACTCARTAIVTTTEVSYHMLSAWIWLHGIVKGTAQQCVCASPQDGVFVWDSLRHACLWRGWVDLHLHVCNTFIGLLVHMQVIERLTERRIVVEKAVSTLGEAPTGLRDVFELCRGFEKAFSNIVNVSRSVIQLTCQSRRQLAPGSNMLVTHAVGL